MDADVTHMAGTPGTPGDPDGDPAEAEKPTGAAEPDDGVSADGRKADTDSGAAEDNDAVAATSDDVSDGASEDASASSAHEEAEGGAGDSDDAGAPPPVRKNHWLRWTALGAAVVILAAAGTSWWFYTKLDGNITSDTSAAAELQTYEKDRPKPVALDAENILLIGSDSRSGAGNGKYGRDDGGSSRSDTTILLHLAADRKSATAVSVPRDLMVDIPSCGKPDGGRSKAQFAQFNWAYEFGGTACTIRTVEKLTGVRIDHQMVIDFSGFKDMVNAVDGVEICLKEPVDDKEAHLKLPAGRQTLNGEQALGFVRARHGIGDGSDTQRMDRQQRFLGALFKKVQSNGVLLNPTRLYPVLDAATKSITTDPGLASLTDLYDLTGSMRDVPTDKVQFLTVPRQPYSADPNRDELVKSAAETLFKQLRDDEPVSVSPKSDSPDGDSSADPDESADRTPDPTSSPDASSSPGSTSSASPSPAPSFTGTNAADGMCE
jgi:LCP family protein required for cell wall assembly